MVTMTIVGLVRSVGAESVTLSAPPMRDGDACEFEVSFANLPASTRRMVKVGALVSVAAVPLDGGGYRAVYLRILR